MQRFNAAVLAADMRLRWQGDRQDPEDLWVNLMCHFCIREARELREAAMALGYFNDDKQERKAKNEKTST